MYTLYCRSYTTLIRNKIVIIYCTIFFDVLCYTLYLMAFLLRVTCILIINFQIVFFSRMIKKCSLEKSSLICAKAACTEYHVHCVSRHVPIDFSKRSWAVLHFGENHLNQNSFFGMSYSILQGWPLI